MAIVAVQRFMLVFAGFYFNSFFLEDHIFTNLNFHRGVWRGDEQGRGGIISADSKVSIEVGEGKQTEIDLTMEMTLILSGLNSANPLVARCIMGQCLCHSAIALSSLGFPTFFHLLYLSTPQIKPTLHASLFEQLKKLNQQFVKLINLQYNMENCFAHLSSALRF